MIPTFSRSWPALRPTVLQRAPTSHLSACAPQAVNAYNPLKPKLQKRGHASSSSSSSRTSAPATATATVPIHTATLRKLKMSSTSSPPVPRRILVLGAGNFGSCLADHLGLFCLQLIACHAYHVERLKADMSSFWFDLDVDDDGGTLDVDIDGALGVGGLQLTRNTMCCCGLSPKTSLSR